MQLLDPRPTTLPDRMPSPFAPAEHPLALRAIAELREHVATLDVDLAADGKMFGVLVVAAPDGRIGYLRAFSGMLGGRWDWPGFAPPAFDVAARDAFWPAGEAGQRALHDELEALDSQLKPLRGELAALDERHHREIEALRRAHQARRQERHDAREAFRRVNHRGTEATENDLLEKDLLCGLCASVVNQSEALDDASRADGAERKRLRARHAAERLPVAERIRGREDERRAIADTIAARSRELLVQIYDTYSFANARGERRTLRDLFAPAEPPGGAGDCAAPKLLAEAYRRGLRPIAFAEIWLGATPAAGGRHHGTLYPACRGKCGPILAHALAGLPCEPLPVFGVPAVGLDEPRVVFEDDWIVIVDKPVGLLSVPGRSDALRDCVMARLRRRYPAATGPLLVHRLDLDTSGLLLAAKDAATHAALQALFAQRKIDKRYVAWLDGAVGGEAGEIALALRVDVDDRPRQIHDPVHGKPALTEWRVIARDGERTRVALHPRTGRTHQLRVHAAHPLGLNAPVIGDRLYGRVAPDGRLLLHAEAIRFAHPHTGQDVAIESRAPF